MRRAVLIALLAVCARAPELAADDTTMTLAERATAKAAAEQLARAAKGQVDKEKHRACGDAFIKLYNSDPTGGDAEDLLWSAGTCFADGGFAGGGIAVFDVLLRYYPTGTHAAGALARVAALYGEVGMIEKAADRLEDYVHKFPAQTDAAPALAQAVWYRRALGQGPKVVVDVEKYTKAYGAKYPGSVGPLTLAMVEVYEERGNRDHALKLVRDYLARYRDHADADDLALARIRLAELAWQASCPVLAVDGLCVTMTRAAPAKGAPVQCGSTARGAVQPVARDALLVKEATEQLALLRPLDDVIAGVPARDPDRVAAVRRAHGKIRLVEADQALEAAIADPFPAHLDFSATNTATRSRSQRQLKDWFVARMAKGTAARKKYDDVLAVKEAESSVGALARHGQLQQLLADTIVTAPIPRELRTGDHVADRVDAYCDKLAEIAEPLVKSATTAFETCVAKSAQLGVRSPWTAVCRREIAQLAPPWSSTVDGEVLAAPRLVPPIPHEPPEDGTTPAHRAALAELRRLDQGVWSERECRRVGKLFEAAAATAPLSNYMAGLAYQRCGLAADAERAYRAALALGTNHASSISQLGWLAHAAGKTEEARELWGNALKVNAKLVGARVGLAAITYAAMVDKSHRDPTWRSLDEEARYHLANALGVEPTDPVILSWLGLVWSEGLDAAPGRAWMVRKVFERAGAGGLGLAAYHLAVGATAARRDQITPSLEAFRKAVALEPGHAGAVIATAQALLRAALPDEAHKLVAPLKTPGTHAYEAQVTLGVALARMAKLDEAEAQYTAAIKTDGHRHEAHFNLGLVHVRRGQKATDLASAATSYTRARDAFKAAADRARGEAKATAQALASDAERAIKRP